VKLYSIGFTKKSAQTFFDLLESAGVKWVMDIRLSPDSQLAGFAKKRDLGFFLEKVSHIHYSHELDLAPSEELFRAFRAKELDFPRYEELFRELLEKRNVIPRYLETIRTSEPICLLCSEATPENCHRRWVAEVLQGAAHPGEIEIVHLQS